MNFFKSKKPFIWFPKLIEIIKKIDGNILQSAIPIQAVYVELMLLDESNNKMKITDKDKDKELIIGFGLSEIKSIASEANILYQIFKGEDRAVKLAKLGELLKLMGNINKFKKIYMWWNKVATIRLAFSFQINGVRYTKLGNTEFNLDIPRKKISDIENEAEKLNKMTAK